MTATAIEVSSERASPACLFENSYRLASLWDIMDHFMVWQLAKALDMIREHEDAYRFMIARGLGGTAIPDADISGHRNLLVYCRDQFMVAELQSAVERIDGPFRIVLSRQGVTHGAVHTEFQVLRECAQSDLKRRLFAFVPTLKARLIDNQVSDWQAVWSAMPDTKTDSIEAIECYALCKDTAMKRLV